MPPAYAGCYAFAAITLYCIPLIDAITLPHSPSTRASLANADFPYNYRNH